MRVSKQLSCAKNTPSWITHELVFQTKAKLTLVSWLIETK